VVFPEVADDGLDGGPPFALVDALGLWRVQGTDLAAALAAPLLHHAPGPNQRPHERFPQIFIRDTAPLDVADGSELYPESDFRKALGINAFRVPAQLKSANSRHDNVVALATPLPLVALAFRSGLRDRQFAQHWRAPCLLRSICH
jgi:hypothetical protein